MSKFMVGFYLISLFIIRLEALAGPIEFQDVKHISGIGGMTWPWLSPLFYRNNDGWLDIAVYDHHGNGAYFLHGKGGANFEPKGFFGPPYWPFKTVAPIYFSKYGDRIDGLGTVEWGVEDYLFLNDAAGKFSKAYKYEGVPLRTGSQGGSLNFVTYFIPNTGASAYLKLYENETLKKEVSIEQFISWPERVNKKPATFEYAQWRHAFYVRLKDKGPPNLFVQFHGKNSFTGQNAYYNWVLQAGNGERGFSWADATEEMGLHPENATYFPLRSFPNEGLDIVNLVDGSCYENQGGTFRKAGELPHGSPWDGDAQVNIVDVTGDGLDDLVILPYHNSNSYGVFVNEGDCKFSYVTDSGIPSYYASRRVAFGDLGFGSGLLDMVVLVDQTSDYLVIERNMSSYKAINIDVKRPGKGLGVKFSVFKAGTRDLIAYKEGFLVQPPTLSTGLQTVNIGVGTNPFVDVKAELPNGQVIWSKNVAAGSTITLTP